MCQGARTGSRWQAAVLPRIVTLRSGSLYHTQDRSRDARRRMFLVPRHGVPRAERRRAGRVGVRGRGVTQPVVPEVCPAPPGTQKVTELSFDPSILSFRDLSACF